MDYRQLIVHIFDLIEFSCIVVRSFYRDCIHDKWISMSQNWKIKKLAHTKMRITRETAKLIILLNQLDFISTTVVRQFSLWKKKKSWFWAETIEKKEKTRWYDEFGEWQLVAQFNALSMRRPNLLCKIKVRMEMNAIQLRLLSIYVNILKASTTSILYANAHPAQSHSKQSQVKKRFTVKWMNSIISNTNRVFISHNPSLYIATFGTIDWKSEWI